jgi:hypothetical protein
MGELFHGRSDNIRISASTFRATTGAVDSKGAFSYISLLKNPLKR